MRHLLESMNISRRNAARWNKMGGSCFQGYNARGRIGNEFNNNSIQIRPSLAKKILIAVQNDILAFLPFHEFKWPGTDRFYIGRMFANLSFAVDMLGKDREKIGMDGRKASRKGMSQLEDGRIWVSGLNLLNCSKRQLAHRMVFFNKFQGEGNIGRCNGFAVMESGPILQVKGIGAPIGGN